MNMNKRTILGLGAGAVGLLAVVLVLSVTRYARIRSEPSQRDGAVATRGAEAGDGPGASGGPLPEKGPGAREPAGVRGPGSFPDGPGGPGAAGWAGRPPDGGPAGPVGPGDSGAGARGPGTAARPTEPPDMDRPPLAATMVGQIHRLVEEARRSAGPEAAGMGREMLESTNPVLRTAGAAILAGNDALDEPALRRLVGDADPAVPLNAIGWLADMGHSEQVGRMADLLIGRGLATDTILDLMGSGRLNGSGARTALELLKDQLDKDEARELYATVGADATAEYAVRMKAVLLLRETLEFEAYRQAVEAMRSEAGKDDALWREGLSRLAARLQGPVPVQAGPVALTMSDVDEMLAREYPMMFEDLALRIEYVVGKNDAYIQPGTAKRLADRVATLRNQPLTEDQQVSLRRLATLAEVLPVRESAGRAPPPGAEAPPGAE